MFETPLPDLIHQLTECESVDERWSRWTAFLHSLGFDQINYAVLNTATEARATASVTQYSTMAADWIEHYLGTRLDLHDPHVRFVREMGWQPYYFAADMADRLPADERAVINQAAEAGLRSQISIVFPPGLNESAPSGGMTIGSSLSARDFRSTMKGNEQWLMALAMIFHSRSLPEVRRSQMKVPPLTSRERDCLKHLADGLRVGRVAERMAISEATVELHLRNARRKLKAATTPQAIARAVLAGELILEL